MKQNPFCFSLSFFFWIYIIPIFRKCRRKNCLSCTYLCQGLIFRFLSFTDEWHPRSWWTWCPFFANVCPELKILFAGKRTNQSFGCKLASLSADFCPQTEDSFPSFLWRKGILLALKGLANHLAFFFSHHFLRSCY